VGADRDTPTKFSRTKLIGDNALMECDLDWVILRPSVVVGRAAYGGSALMRGLAALPVLPVMPNTGRLQIVHLDDVVDAAMFFLRPDAAARPPGPSRGWSRFSAAGCVGRRPARFGCPCRSRSSPTSWATRSRSSAGVRPYAPPRSAKSGAERPAIRNRSAA